MRIALIRKELSLHRGGVERYAVALARGLAERGHEVHVVVGSADVDVCHGITVHRVPFLRKPSSLKNASFQHAVKKLVAGLRVDIVHGLSQVYPQDVYRVGEPLHVHWLITRFRSRLLRLVLFCTLRHQVILSIERNIFRSGNYRRIMVNSQLCRQQVLEYYKVPETKIRLVYNGVDTTCFFPDSTGKLRTVARQTLGLRADERVLVFAGNDFKRKGLWHALAAVRILQDRGYALRFLIAGSDSRQYAQRCVAAQGVADSVVWVGSVPEPQVLYHAADLLVLPSRYDPFANVCLEAMACGVPVVTSRCNGAAELITPGVSGYSIDNPTDHQAIADALAEFFDASSVTRQNMQHAAAAIAHQYTLERNLEKTLRVYDEIIREKQTGRGEH